MYADHGGPRSPLTPQLAVRVAVLGGVALLAFGAIFFRLWYLQVLSGDSYRAEANDNRVREIEVQAPRGEIVDREGRVLVENRVGLAVNVSPETLPGAPAARARLYRRLGAVLRVHPREVRRRVESQLEEVPFSTATVKRDVGEEVVAYLLEHQSDFPGVKPEPVFLRDYPLGDVGAHILGYVGEVSPEQLEGDRFREVGPGDLVGKAGIEYEYDRFLRGRNGATRVQVDALGTLRGSPLSQVPPEQGRQLRLSLDLDVQQAGQDALAAVGDGAFVAMDVDSGEILGLGSSPTFDANLFSPAISNADWAHLNSEEAGNPLANRAVDGAYPAGSTFKPVTALATLEGGVTETETVIYDDGALEVGGVTWENAGGGGYGPIAMRDALKVSSNVFFATLGLEAHGSGDGLVIQDWARRLGFGRPTGIDLPTDSAGLVPTPKWRQRLFEEDVLDRPWAPGDNVNLSLGQGDLRASPLQLAVAYAAIANGGRVVEPRLGLRIEDSAGRPLQELEAPRRRRVRLAEEHRQTILDGLRAAASEAGGTSADVFAGFGIDVAGKTGTAEKGAGRPDQSWYAALAPYPSPRYVVVATFEQGGFGAATAAPAARRILAALFDLEDSGPAPVGGAYD